MPITHAVVKAPGNQLAAVADWNANHVVTGYIMADGSIPFTGDQDTVGAAATALNLLVDSPNFGFVGHYWNGAVSVARNMVMYNQIINDAGPPYAQFVIEDEAGGIFIIRPSTDSCTIFGGNTTADNLILYANTFDTYPYVTIFGGGGFVFTVAELEDTRFTF